MFAILLTLIFIRPFISSLAFPYLNSIYSTLFLIFLIVWVFYKGVTIKKIHFSRKSASPITFSTIFSGVIFILSYTIKYPLILFCLALTISIVFSSNKLNSFKELYKYISGLLLFLIAASLEHEDKIKVIHTMVITGLVISLLAIYQYFLGFQHILDYITQQQSLDPFVLDYLSRKRVFFPFVTPNTLAGYLAMIIPLTLTHKNKIWFILPLSFALLLTKSLGGILSILLALAIYFYLQDKFKKREIIFMAGLLIISGLVFIARATTSKQHLQPIFSTLMRINYWKDTLRIIGANPLIGVGLGNFNLVQSRYAHNSYLQIWAEMGILGIISILWLIIVVFKSALKDLKDSSDKKLLTVLLTANVVFLIHNLIDFSFFLPEVSLIWWVIIGYIFNSKIN